jgi:N5-(cytidine 5'-diphosphoramidyl)-L-glutamine hydrolase
MANELRVGLTMREVHANGYDEPRDALARKWGEFLQAAVPEVAWLPIPNLGPAVAPLFCDRWGINALILTGGEDIGVSLVRDATERALLRHFLRNDRPVLGVCRGLQLMWTEIGGEIEHKEGHVAARHPVRYLREASLDITDSMAEVNSFHGFSLRESAEAMREPVIVFARADDGTAEGVRFCNGRMAGVMWHPEREETASTADISLIRGLFGLEKAGGK